MDMIQFKLEMIAFLGTIEDRVNQIRENRTSDKDRFVCRYLFNMFIANNMDLSKRQYIEDLFNGYAFGGIKGFRKEMSELKNIVKSIQE